MNISIKSKNTQTKYLGHMLKFCFCFYVKGSEIWKNLSLELKNLRLEFCPFLKVIQSYKHKYL